MRCLVLRFTGFKENPQKDLQKETFKSLTHTLEPSPVWINPDAEWKATKSKTGNKPILLLANFFGLIKSFLIPNLFT
mgnify:CR=1 FL=1